MPESVLSAVHATERPVPDVLLPWVCTLWSLEAQVRTRVRSVPDGCLDVVVTPQGVQVSGALSEPAVWDLPAGTHLTGARLRPGAGALLGIAADQLPPRWTPLRELVPVDPDHELVEVLARRALVTQADPRLAEALALLARATGALAIPVVARRVGVSERTLGRLFLTHVGLGPRAFGRVLRFQAALRLVRTAPDLAAVAFQTGYADQAHLSREFAALAGLPPRAVRQAQGTTTAGSSPTSGSRYSPSRT